MSLHDVLSGDFFTEYVKTRESPQTPNCLLVCNVLTRRRGGAHAFRGPEGNRQRLFPQKRLPYHAAGQRNIRTSGPRREAAWSQGEEGLEASLEYVARPFDLARLILTFSSCRVRPQLPLNVSGEKGV